MTGRISKLQQELKKIEQSTTELAVKLKSLYAVYLDKISQSFYKQFILATYQICTQKYPQAFLNLTYNQREKLQQDLINIAKEGQRLLLELKEIKFTESSPVSLHLSTLPSPLLTPENLSIDIVGIKSPHTLLEWSKSVEKGIAEVLQTISKEANQKLQQSAILPIQLPPQVLDMAIQAQQEGQPISGGNNLLNVLVEAENKKADPENPLEEMLMKGSITQITAIYLRVAEIEFADPAIGVERNQIRGTIEQIHQLGRQYNKTEHEYSIAQAESAWRTSWYDS